MDIADIRLFDFGGSPCQIGDRTRADLPIPEQIFTGMHDFRADLWLAGYAVCGRVIVVYPTDFARAVTDWSTILTDVYNAICEAAVRLPL